MAPARALILYTELYLRTCRLLICSASCCEILGLPCFVSHLELMCPASNAVVLARVPESHGRMMSSFVLSICAQNLQALTDSGKWLLIFQLETMFDLTKQRGVKMKSSCYQCKNFNKHLGNRLEKLYIFIPLGKHHYASLKIKKYKYYGSAH